MAKLSFLLAGIAIALGAPSSLATEPDSDIRAVDPIVTFENPVYMTGMGADSAGVPVCIHADGLLVANCDGAVGPPGPGDAHSLDADDGDPVDVVYVNSDGLVGIGPTAWGRGEELSISDGLGEPGHPMIAFNERAMVGYHGGRAVMQSGGNKNIELIVNSWDFGVGTTGIYIHQTGNVGIGTQTPSAKLDVAGAINIQGADLAEQFPVSEKVNPGMVVAIDPHNPGKLRLSREAYDTRVAGIVSGAKGLSAGAVLGNLPGMEGDPAIALSGRVWCLVDADSGGPVTPGDMLTTSGIAGHAMKATDHARAQGAVLGKAMTGLEQGKDLVLVLVNLQ